MRGFLVVCLPWWSGSQMLVFLKETEPTAPNLLGETSMSTTSCESEALEWKEVYQIPSLTHYTQASAEDRASHFKHYFQRFYDDLARYPFYKGLCGAFSIDQCFDFNMFSLDFYRNSWVIEPMSKKAWFIWWDLHFLLWRTQKTKSLELQIWKDKSRVDLQVNSSQLSC